MSSLDQKLFRDLGTIKGQIMSVVLVMACGPAMMILTRSLILSLEESRANYYQAFRFGQIFCELTRAPNAMCERLKTIPGVAQVETRVIERLRVEIPGGSEIVEGRIISIPKDRPRMLNAIFLKEGRFPETGSEVIVSEQFALAHSLRPGDTIEVTLRGVREGLEIVGLGLSPENVFETQPGGFLPDGKRFGIFWMRERELAAACGLVGAFNQVVVHLAPGADSRHVMEELNRLLAPYGALTAYERADHSSDRALSAEIQILSALSIVFPLAFLGVSTLMVVALVARLVHIQREQVAQLKALGYSALQIGAHYMKFAAAIAAFGAFVGVSAGAWLGSDVLTVYRQFFRFPSLPFDPDYSAIGLAVAISVAFPVLGVSGVVRQVMRLPPAEAMRPKAPASFTPSILERVGARRLLSQSTRIALRNLERKPWQASFTVIGLAIATGVPIVPGALRDGIDHLANFQWTLAQRQSVTVSLVEPGSAAAFCELTRLPGVIYAEPFRRVQVRLYHEHRSGRITINGVSRDAHLTRVLGKSGTALSLLSTGLLISRKLAEVLGAKPGDRLWIELLEGRRGWHELRIQGLIEDYRELNATIDIEVLRRMMVEGETISGGHLTVDTSHWPSFLARAKQSPRIASLGITSMTLAFGSCLRQRPDLPLGTKPGSGDPADPRVYGSRGRQGHDRRACDSRPARTARWTLDRNGVRGGLPSRGQHRNHQASSASLQPNLRHRGYRGLAFRCNFVRLRGPEHSKTGSHRCCQGT
jgi:putative ABC transport system permease protein